VSTLSIGASDPHLFALEDPDPNHFLFHSKHRNLFLKSMYLEVSKFIIVTATIIEKSIQLKLSTCLCLQINKIGNFFHFLYIREGSGFETGYWS